MHRIITSALIPVLTLAIVAASPRAPHAQQTAASTAPGGVVLLPTNHPHLPADASQLWMAPDRTHTHTAAMNEFAAAVKLEVDSNYAKALPVFSQPSLQKGPLGDYAVFYRGLAEMRLGQPADAKRTFQSMQAGELTGYLVEGAAVKEAECDEALGDQAAAAAIYERLSADKTTAPDDILMRLGRTAKASGDTEKAGRAFGRVYYEFPLSDLSSRASGELEALPNVQPIAPGNGRYKLEMGRAERLFRQQTLRAGAHRLRWPAKRRRRAHASCVNLRVAECDFFSNARATRATKCGRTSIARRARPRRCPSTPSRRASWAIGHTEDGPSARRRIPGADVDGRGAQQSRHATSSRATTTRPMRRSAMSRSFRSDATRSRGVEDRLVGVRNDRFADTRACSSRRRRLPRSDYRPMWYAGRAARRAQRKTIAERVYSGGHRLSQQLLRPLAVSTSRPPERAPISTALSGRPWSWPRRARRRGHADAPAADADESDCALRRTNADPRLLGLELFDQAVDVLHYAQKNWGDSSAIQATLGWIAHERGDLRAGINGMKRAYPQYLAAGGEQLPTELLKVLFPVNYWPEIRRYAAEHHLDPYMIAALIAQESTFSADAKSPANAYGLMQIVPAAGRHYASVLHLKRFSIGMLTTADTNLKMGTAYFADLVARFGGAHYALASYNAGESRVVRWIAERPGVEKEVFIDDIPFPETQNYVKKILGTAEDYRRLCRRRTRERMPPTNRSRSCHAGRQEEDAARRPRRRKKEDQLRDRGR